MRTKKMKLVDLKPASWNPRMISASAMAGLRKSIDEFGLVQPIIVNEQTGNVVGGHQRLKVLLERGEKTTDVILVDMPEIKEKALNVSLNNQHIAGEFTPDLGVILEAISIELPDLAIDLRLDEITIPEITIDKPPPEPGDGPGNSGAKTSPAKCPECGHNFSIMHK